MGMKKNELESYVFQLKEMANDENKKKYLKDEERQKYLDMSTEIDDYLVFLPTDAKLTDITDKIKAA
jgi:hypothetical protein